MRDILRWLPARQRTEYGMAALVRRCLLGLASTYLVELCGPTLIARSCSSLRSAEQGLLHVPFASTSTVQKRGFAVYYPSIWNGLPLSIRSLPRTFSQAFLSQFKVVLFRDVNKDLTHKDKDLTAKDQDKDLTPKDKDLDPSFQGPGQRSRLDK